MIEIEQRGTHIAFENQNSLFRSFIKRKGLFSEVLLS